MTAQTQSIAVEVDDDGNQTFECAEVPVEMTAEIEGIPHAGQFENTFRARVRQCRLSSCMPLERLRSANGSAVSMRRFVRAQRDRRRECHREHEPRE